MSYQNEDAFSLCTDAQDSQNLKPINDKLNEADPAGLMLPMEDSEKTNMGPNFKLGEAAPAGLSSSIFQKNNILILEDIEESFVVLGKNVMESIRGSSPLEPEEVPRSEYNESVFSSVSDSQINNKLHEVLEENMKLKKTIEQNDSDMKQQFDKIATWQKEVLSVCNDHKQRYIETKKLIKDLKAENDLLRKNTSSQVSSQNTNSILSSHSSAKSQLLNVVRQSVGTERELDNTKLPGIQNLTLNELSDKPGAANKPDTMNNIMDLVDQMMNDIRKDTSLESNVTISSLDNQSLIVKASRAIQCESMKFKSNCTELPEKNVESSGVLSIQTETPRKVSQCVSISTETESDRIRVPEKQIDALTGRSINTQTIARPTQCVSTETESVHTAPLERIADRSVETQTLLQETQSVSTGTQSLFTSTSVRTNLILEDRSIQTQTPITVTQCVNTTTELNDTNLHQNKIETLADLSTKVRELQAVLSRTSNKTNDNSMGQQKLVVSSTDDAQIERDIEILYLTQINKSLQEQIEKLEKNALPAVELKENQSVDTSIDGQALKENVDAYNERLRELTNCFVSMYSRYIKGQRILKECATIVKIFENADFIGDSSLTEDTILSYKNKLCDYRKKLVDEQLQIIDDKQTIITAQKQFQKILSDYNNLVYELAYLRQENLKIKTNTAEIEEENVKRFAEMEKLLDERERKLNEERASLIEQKQSLGDERDVVRAKLEEIMAETQTLLNAKEKLEDEKKGLSELAKLIDRQKELHEVEKSLLQKELSLLKQNCEDLTKKFEDLKTERETLNAEKQHLAEDETNLEELKAVFNEEFKTHQIEKEGLYRENRLLSHKNKILEADLDNFNKELVSAHKLITQLRKKNSELTETVEIVEALKIQNEEHEKDILQMFDTEKNYLDQIEALTHENRKLRDENDQLKNNTNE